MTPMLPLASTGGMRTRLPPPTATRTGTEIGTGKGSVTELRRGPISPLLGTILLEVLLPGAEVVGEAEAGAEEAVLHHQHLGRNLRKEVSTSVQKTFKKHGRNCSPLKLLC